MRGRFNRLVCAVCIMLFGFYSVSVNSATAGTAVFKTMNITGKSRTSSGIKVDYAVKTQFDHPSIPQNKNVSAGFMAADLAVLFASLKNRNPGAAAVTAGTVAAAAAGGWIIDELTGQIVEPVEVESTGPDVPINGFRWDSATSGYFDTAIEAATAQANANGTGLVSTESVTQESSVRYKLRFKYTHADGRVITSAVYAHPCTPCVYDDIPTHTENRPVDQSEIDEKVKDWLKAAPWSILDDLLKHPDGTTVDNEPLRRAISDWLDDLASKDPNLRYVPPASIVVTNPDGSETPVDFEPNPEPDASTEEKTRPDAADWPLFCEWAPVICDWLEWTKEMPEDMEPEEFPIEELTVADIRKDYNSGLGGGSCPSPVTTSFMGSQIVFSYETACYGARTYFKPVLLMIAGIIAAFIIVGASRRT